MKYTALIGPDGLCRNCLETPDEHVSLTLEQPGDFIVSITPEQFNSKPVGNMWADGVFSQPSLIHIP